MNGRRAFLTWAIRILVLTVVLGAVLWRPWGSLQAQGGTVIQVDVAANRRPIDPRVYGVNWAEAAQLAALNVPIHRWGGNSTSRHNWKTNGDNRGSDWYFESIPGSGAPGAAFDSFVQKSRANGASPMATIPLLAWVGKNGPNGTKLASFSAAKYGQQQDCDWQWFPDACNGVRANGSYITGNDPNDANVAVNPQYQKEWAQYLVSRWGSALNGGVRYYIYDNEPSLWHHTHRDVHPAGQTMTELRDLMIAYGTAIKQADPGAVFAGPEEWGWSGYFYSGKDQKHMNETQCWTCAPDRTANGGMDFAPWLLAQMRQHEQATGNRLLHIFTLHYYPQGGEFGNDTSSSMQARRNRSTRSLWDPNYTDETWIGDRVRLIPRMKDWVNTHYPGLETGITEYNWGAEEHINGATTQADILGIFGREGLNVGTRWTTPAMSTPTFKAFQMYRNYDGAKSTFGNVSVKATVPNPDNLSAFAAERTSDGSVTVMAINKVATSALVNLSIANFTTGTTAQVWRLTSANAIQRQADITVTGGTINTTLPAQSITLFVVPRSNNSTPSLSISDASVNEGIQGVTNATFTVTLSAAASANVTVNYSTTNDTATAGSDYTATSGSLTFTPGQTSKTLTVPVLGDTSIESDEIFHVILSPGTNATLLDRSGVGTIRNDDLPAVSIGDVTVTEGNSGSVSASFPVTLSAASPSSVTVSYSTANGTAVAPGDYATLGGSVNFTAGQTSKTIVVSVVGDTVVEPNETFLVNLSGPVGAAIRDGQGVGTIANDDLPAVSVGDVTVTEGNSGSVSASFNVILSAASPSSVTVSYSTANGTAVAPGDYATLGGSVNFTAGQTSKTIVVSVVGDTVVEPNETFLVNLSGPVGAAIRDGQGVGTIANDDAATTPPPVGAQPVVWTSLVGVTANGNSLTKTAATAWGNAGAVSTQQIASGDGYVEFTASETNTYRMLGLSRGNTDVSWQDIDFAIYQSQGQLKVYESGVLAGTFGTYVAGDRLRVAVVGGVVKYSKNGVVFHASTKAPVYPLLVDTALYTVGSTLTSVVIAGASTPPPPPVGTKPVVWTSLVGVTANGNWLSKTAATAWGNAGAVSTQQIASGDGYVEFTASETNTYRMLGLSRGNTDVSWQDIDFAIYQSQGQLKVYESGVLAGTFGTYVAGDRLRVAVVGGVVKYSKNGVVFHTSTKAPVYPLLVDTALYTVGSTLTNVVIATGSSGPPIPELARWEADMLTYGRRHCANYDLPNLTLDQLLGATYYDAIRVFYQIADYSRDSAFNQCAIKARTVYRDRYVLPNHGGVPGYWNFTAGLRMDWERTKDAPSRTAVVELSRNAAYAADLTPIEWTKGTGLSREVAYSIMGYLNAEAVGEPRRARLSAHVNQALGHIDQWFISKTSRAPVPFNEVPDAAGKYYIQPFMVGLTTQALIRYYEATGDPRVLPAVKTALDAIWERAWVPADQAFWYQNWVSDPSQAFPAQPGAPDLNHLIAPAFAWVYRQTGDTKYRDRGDQIFAGGVKRAWLDGAKQFNQSYMWSFDYVRWRSGQ